MKSSRLGFLVFTVLLLVGVGCTELVSSSSTIQQPLERALERDKLLTFGMFVTPDPDQNPIDPPERFYGFHSALDYEVFPDEIGKEVQVFAICDGEVMFSKYVDGYGGTFIQQCKIQGDETTVLYGHLDQASIMAQVGDALKAGDVIGILGDHKTDETSDNRMHLHLGIHKGTDIVLSGYVQNEAELAEYIDPAVVLGY